MFDLGNRLDAQMIPFDLNDLRRNVRVCLKSYVYNQLENVLFCTDKVTADLH